MAVRPTLRALALLVCLAAAVANSVIAQSGNGYDLSWARTGTGGGLSSGGDWTVEGSTGQSVADKSSGGDWAVQGGFWNRVSGNFSPVARTVTFARAKNVPIKIRITDLMTNGFDPDGETAVFFGAGPTSTNGGAISTNSTYVFYSLPGSNPNLPDRFAWRIRDGFQGLGLGTVIINVTNAFGTVSTISVSGSTATVMSSGIAGYSYELQRSTNLTSWVTLLTTNTPAGGIFEFVDNFSDLGGPPPQAFYRLRQP
jgi:hypothetical protein